MGSSSPQPASASTTAAATPHVTLRMVSPPEGRTSVASMILPRTHGRKGHATYTPAGARLAGPRLRPPAIAALAAVSPGISWFAGPHGGRPRGTDAAPAARLRAPRTV